LAEDSARPLAGATASARVLYREAALTDARSPELRVGVSILVEDDRITWIRPADDEGDLVAGDDPGGPTGRGPLEIVDAAGTTIVPGMVDSHSHVTLPGGAHWIERGGDPPATLLAAAERNAELQLSAGVRWARDVGSPTATDPTDGRHRALALGLRDRWAGRRDRPYIRAAGTWLASAGLFTDDLVVEAKDGDELLAGAVHQLDDGADLVKLYLQGPDPNVSPWTEHEVARVVEAAHARGKKVTAHAVESPGARAAVLGGVDSIEHGWQIDAELAQEMARQGCALSATLTPLKSFLGFGRTTRIERFGSAAGQQRNRDGLAAAQQSVRNCRAAGVLISSGTDFGGGSTRPNMMAWEVESLVEAGLEPWEALAAATWHGGELLGEPEAGVIREGGPADFFLVHGDPLSDPSALWRVWRVA
jgi:imidazolonepropionase-like amidohydrolase